MSFVNQETLKRIFCHFIQLPFKKLTNAIKLLFNTDVIFLSSNDNSLFL